MAEAGNGQVPPPDRPFVRLLLRASVLGPTSALLAIGYVTALHELEVWIWHDLPRRLGLSDAPWWWVVLLLVTGAVLTAFALRLPGHGGHSPMDGLAFDVGPVAAISVVAAATASLTFGAVLGPEAPALAIGTGLGYLFATVGRPATAETRQQAKLLMLAGGMAAFGAVLGNPLALAIFVLEAALLARRGVATSLTLAPIAVSLAFGYIVQVGTGQWTGLPEVVLAVPTIEPYPTVLAADLLVVVVLAAIIALIVHLAFVAAGWVRHWGEERPPIVTLMVAAVGTAVVALAAQQVTGVDLRDVLFSGQPAIPELVTETSVGALLTVVAAKAIAYALCMGGGFRGGPVFPAITLAVGLASATAILVAPASSSGLVAAGIGAGTAAVIRMPFSSALLATLLTWPAGPAVTTLALLGAVMGLLVVLLLDHHLGPRIVAPKLRPRRAATD